MVVVEAAVAGVAVWQGIRVAVLGAVGTAGAVVVVSSSSAESPRWAQASAWHMVGKKSSGWSAGLAGLVLFLGGSGVAPNPK